jgi:hypothetical protein
MVLEEVQGHSRGLACASDDVPARLGLTEYGLDLIGPEDTGGEFYPLLTQPVAVQRIGSSGFGPPASPPTSH